MQGVRHSIKCTCVLPQFKKLENPLQHEFAVFSVYDDVTDTVTEKHAQCDNCGAVHRVFDVCKSEILRGKEKSSLVRSIDEIKLSVPERLVGILQQNDSHVSVWEQVEYIVANEVWGSYVRLSSELNDDNVAVKVLFIHSRDAFRVETHSRVNVIPIKDKSDASLRKPQR